MKNTIDVELKHMKYLKIKDNKGYYLTQNEQDWNEIDKLSKEDLMFLLEKVISSEFEMDEFVEENIQHKAHLIVYKSIHEKFSNLLENKNSFIDECDLQYRNAIEKYENPDEQ